MTWMKRRSVSAIVSVVGFLVSVLVVGGWGVARCAACIICNFST